MKNTKTKTTKKAGTRPARRRIVKRSAPDMAALLRAAGDLDMKLYAAEGMTNFKERALASVQRMKEAGITHDKFQDADWILVLQFIRDKCHEDQIFEDIKRDFNVGPDEIFAGIDSFVHKIAWEDAEILRLSKAIDDLYKEYGAAEDEYWPDGEAPEDMEELRTAFYRRLHQLKVAILRHHGEDTMADLLEDDPDDYDARVETGMKTFNKKH